MVGFHHLLASLVVSMVFRSSRLVATILVVDVTGKSHCLTFAPHAVAFGLRTEVDSKFNLAIDLYWLSSRDNPWAVI